MIQFILNDEIIQTTANAGITLLDFIREHKHLKGTKIGCREGDCGACTVLVGDLKNDAVSYHNITSCISPLGNANGKHIVTVEGINLPKSLNTVQQAMSDNFATQCGFCTPGFVVSMTGYAMQEKREELGSCNDAISGNICRCTGYKSIEKAGFEIEDKLKDKNSNDSIQWLIDKGFIPDYFQSISKKLKSIKPEALPTIGKVVANGTDLYVRYADQLADQEVHLITQNIKLSGISSINDSCIVGMNTTVTDLLEDENMKGMFPKMAHFLKLVSSEPIRNMGTLGGNFVNASPIGDMTIFFLALNPEITILASDNSERKIPFNTFYKGYKTYDLQEGEVLKSLTFNKIKEGEYYNFEKVCKRKYLDIATVNSAIKITLNQDKVKEAHVSIGGVAAIPTYLFKTSAFLIGKAITAATIKEAADVLSAEISPISDVRGTADYKRLLARQLFFAHFIELFPEHIQLQNLIS